MSTVCCQELNISFTEVSYNTVQLSTLQLNIYCTFGKLTLQCELHPLKRLFSTVLGIHRTVNYVLHSLGIQLYKGTIFCL